MSINVRGEINGSIAVIITQAMKSEYSLSVTENNGTWTIKADKESLGENPTPSDSGEINDSPFRAGIPIDGGEI